MPNTLDRRKRREEEKRDGREREEEEVGGWGGLFEKVGFWKDVLFERMSLENLRVAMSKTKPKRNAHYLNDALLAKQMLIISLECALFLCTLEWQSKCLWRIF